MSAVRDVMLVGTGGFIGAVARYLTGALINQALAAPRFPVATLTVNVVGCLVIGVLAGLAEQGTVLSPQVRLLLITGVLGGFTTFSAFGYETHFLAREHLIGAAALNVILHLALALPAVWAGHRLGVALAV